MSFFESIYLIEEILCEDIKKNIAELLADDEFNPYYKHPDNKERIVFIRNEYKDFYSSQALSDYLDMTHKQYISYRKSKK